MAVATVFAIGLLIFVPTDFILDRKRKKKDDQTAEEASTPEETLPNEQADPIPEPLPIVPPVIKTPVAEINAELADELLSDSDAASVVQLEDGAGDGPRSYINIGIINECFSAGDTVTLFALKEKGLVEKKIQRIKILADGILSKPLTVKAEFFSMQAIKMIELTGGTVIILK